MKEQTGRIPRRLTVKLLAFLLTCGMFLSMNAEAFAASVSDSDAPEQAAVSQSDAPAQTVIKDRQETAPKKSTTATASGQCGDNLTWEYDDSTYTLTIRGSGHMWNFRGERPWRSYQSSIESIVFDGNITSITEYAFCDFTSLKNISIPDTVTSIGENAFAYCRSLKSINIPDSVTSIGASAFSDCSSLTTVVLSDSITTIDNYTFYNCGSLTSVNIPDSLTSIGDRAFGCCARLESVILPDSLTTIGGCAFLFCTDMTSINIPDSVTSIGGSAFLVCTDMTSITVSSGNTCYASVDGVLFDHDKTRLICCPGGKTGGFSIPGSTVTIEGYAFYMCASLTNVTMTDSVTGIGEYAFDDCASLTDINLSHSITSIEARTFDGCTSLTSITIPDSVTSIGSYAFSGCSSMKTVILSESLNAISYYAFNWCSALENITIPDSVTSIGEYAFCGCASLTSITIPNSVTSIGDYAFSKCSNLVSITIPDSVTTIGEGAFQLCSKLESVTLPNSISTINNYTFRNCGSLTYISIPNSVNTIKAGSFDFCHLNSISLPKSIVHIYSHTFGEDITDIYYEGFYEDWKTISIGYQNESFKNATIHYGLMGTKENYQVFFDQNPEGLSSAEIVFNADIKSVALDDSHRITVYQRQNYTDSDNDNYHEKVLFRISSADDPRLTVGTDRISVDLSALPEDCTASIALDNDTITLTDNTVALITKGNREVCRYTHRPEVTANVSFASDGDKAKENNGDLDHSFRYSDQFFYYDNTDYHNDLAVMSLGLELTSWSKSAYSNGNYYTEKLDYYTRAQNLINMYNQLMVVDREYHNYDIPLSDNKDKVAYSLGLKYIQDSEGNTDTLIVLPVRGGGYGAEWASNFRVEGNSGNHYGFQLAAGDIYSSLQAYLKKLE